MYRGPITTSGTPWRWFPIEKNSPKNGGWTIRFELHWFRWLGQWWYFKFSPIFFLPEGLNSIAGILDEINMTYHYQSPNWLARFLPSAGLFQKTLSNKIFLRRPFKTVEKKKIYNLRSLYTNLYFFCFGNSRQCQETNGKKQHVDLPRPSFNRSDWRIQV